MSSEALRAATVYRQLLKSVKKIVGVDGSKKHFTDYIMEEFRKNRGLWDVAIAQRKIKLAQDYNFLINSVNEHKELLFSYDIAIDRSNEMDTKLNQSAASVGFSLPKAYEP